MSSPGGKILLQCVSEGGKLRIKFYAFINDEGKVFKDVYNPHYNCQFPKDIRQAGAFYEIPDINLTLSDGGTKQPFYRVKKDGIRILTPGIDPLSGLAVVVPSSSSSSAAAIAPPVQIYAVEECVICLSCSDLIIMTPCGHQCVCADCYRQIPAKFGAKKCCPLCRRAITGIITPAVVPIAAEV